MKQSNSHPNTEKSSNNLNKESYFALLKSGDYSESFPKVEKWIREKSIQQNNKQAERKTVKMKNYILAHKMRLVYTVIALAIIVGACSLPVTQNETIGHIISWTLPGGSQTNLTDNLPWIDKTKLSLSKNNNNGKVETICTLMLPGSTDEQVQKYQTDLEKIKEITSVKVFPLSENVKRPVYSAALHSFFRVNINATKMNDEELSNEIQKQLKEQGMESIFVNLKTDENGKRQIQMKMENICDTILNKGDNNPKNFELRINDDKDGKKQEEVMKIVKKPLDQEKLKNMTDEQIRNYVREDLGNPDIKDNEIKISREKGDVQIKVEVERNK